MTIIVFKAFIPRIFGNIRSSQIRKTFVDNNIGKVSSINIHRRKNENKHLYGFAFMTIELFENVFATTVYKELTESGCYKLFYDKNNYWEVKKYITRKERASISNTLLATTGNDEIDDYSDTDNEGRTAFCDNCGEDNERGHPTYKVTIFSRSFECCSNNCIQELEFDIRKDFCRSQRKARQAMNATQMIPPVKPISVEVETQTTDKQPTVFTAEDHAEMVFDFEELLQESALQINMEDESEGTSKFMEMFQNIQSQADSEMENIQFLNRELMKRPTPFIHEYRPFTREYYPEMESDFEESEDSMKLVL